MTTVTCAGLVVADTVLEVDAVPAAGTKSFATRMSEQAGGPAATAAVTVARLGGLARFIGRVGDDERGRRLRWELEAEGIDTTGLEVLGGVPTSISMVLVTPDGERTIVNHTHPDLLGPADPLVQGDVVLVDAHWATGADAVLEASRAMGIPSVLDLDRSPNHGESLALGHLAEHPIASLDAARRLTGEEKGQDCLLHLVELIGPHTVVTAGAEGLWWLNDGRIAHLAAPAVTVVETMGAGDVFHGAFAWALGEGMEVGRALEAASRVAAERCRRRGGWQSIPKEVPWN